MDALPQLTSLGGYLALCAFIYKLFEKGDDLINDDAKLGLAIWILNLKAPERMQSWPALFAHWFDKVFGKKHLTWRCFFRSCLASLAAVLLVTLVWAALRPQELRLILDGFWRAPSLGELIQSIFLYFVVLNLLPDYLSLLETRFIIKLMSGRDSFVWHALLLVMDAVLTLLIAIALPLALSLLSFAFVSSEPVSLKAYLTEVLPLTGKSTILRGVGAPFLAICFYTAFLTSVWIWFYAVSGFLIKALALWEFAKSKVKLEEKPLTTVGVVTIMLVTVVFFWVSVLPIQGGQPAADRSGVDGLRSHGMEISVEDVQKMIEDYGYYDVDFNVRGRGIENDYRLLPGDSTVYDAKTQLHWQRSGSASYITYENAQAYVDSLNAAAYAGTVIGVCRRSKKPCLSWNRHQTMIGFLSIRCLTKRSGGFGPLIQNPLRWRGPSVSVLATATSDASTTSTSCERYAEDNHRSFGPLNHLVI